MTVISGRNSDPLKVDVGNIGKRMLNYVLQACPLLDQLSHQIRQTNTTLDGKLWGSLDDLCRTTHFMVATGLRV